MTVEYLNTAHEDYASFCPPPYRSPDRGFFCTKIVDFCNTLHESLNQVENMASKGKLDGINTRAPGLRVFIFSNCVCLFQ